MTADLVHEIISDSSYSVRILSLRDAKNLDEPKLRTVLQTAVRRSRPEGTPRLKGLYIFGAKEPPPLPAPPAPPRDESSLPGWNLRPHKALTAALHDGADKCLWYDKRGRNIPRHVPEGWASTVRACAGLISFDAVLCRGPRHANSPAHGTIDIVANSPPPPYKPSKWAIATHSVEGCDECGSAPEGWTTWGESAGIDADGDTYRFPLLAPPPLHTSNLKAACCPRGGDMSSRATWTTQASGKRPRRFIARCLECLRDRCCWSCSKWWCERCFDLGQVDFRDGLYYKVRESFCVMCEEAAADRFGGCFFNSPVD